MPNRNPYSFEDCSEYVPLIKSACDPMTPHFDDGTNQDLEGDYVDLLDTAVTAETRPIAPCHREMEDANKFPKGNEDPVTSVTNNNKWVCGRLQASEKGACTPCLRRKFNKDSDAKETKCRFRQSYVAALKNPVSFTSAPMDEISEEPMSRSTTFAALESPICSRRKTQSQAHSSWLFSPKTGESKSGDVYTPLQNPKTNPTSGSDSSSPSLVHRFSFLRGQRNSSSGSDGLSMDSNSSQYSGTWRRVSAVCSPRLSRAKFSGKGIGEKNNIRF